MAITAAPGRACHSRDVGWICNESSLPSRAQTTGRNFVFRPFFFVPRWAAEYGVQDATARQRFAVRENRPVVIGEKNGRSGGIRTHDPHTPSVVRYQAALRSDYFNWGRDRLPWEGSRPPAGASGQNPGDVRAGLYLLRWVGATTLARSRRFF